jgi:uncharacterized protein (TIGR03435 family)
MRPPRELSKASIVLAIRKILVLLFAPSMPILALAQMAVPAATVTATNPAAAFDVVSIKPAKPDAVGSSSNSNNESFTTTNSTLKSLMEYDAYQIPRSQIFGIPPALEKAAFDIQAKLDPEVYARIKKLDSEQRRLQWQGILQQMLADRFKLAVHTETRQLPVYALVIAKGGPKLESAKDTKGSSRSASTERLKATGVTTEDLAKSLTRILSNEVGRVVVDQTGLTGKYDLTLKWTPDNAPPPMLNGEPDTSAPSIFTAVQEQLGLKLESTKAPVQVLVVDHAELPSEN